MKLSMVTVVGLLVATFAIWSGDVINKCQGSELPGPPQDPRA
jgi:hypothetical protein